MSNFSYKMTGALALLAIVCVTSSSATDLRDVTAFRFPGPRPSVDETLSSESTDPLTASAARAIVKREPQYEDSPYDYAATARPTPGYRSQQAPSPLPYQQENRYAPSPAPSSYNAPRSASVRQPSVNYGSTGSQYGSPAGSSSSPAAAANEEQPEEENKGPSKLELLLAQSKFACDGKKDGYYADASVGCQVFHYCVQGAKHSWMCPEQTVFHQVHLNCVPAAQDICSQSEKFFVVNDYLHKEIDQRGPNNSVRYHQRYYPEEFLGDAALNIPQSFGFAPNEAPSQPQRAQATGSYSPQRPSRPAYSEESESAPYYKPQSYASSPAAASQSYKPIATRANSYSQAAPSSGYGSTSVPNSAVNQYSPSSYGSAASSAGLTASRSTSSASYPSSYPSSSSSASSYPASYSAPAQSYSPSARPSTGLRYAQSAGVPVSYQPTSARATGSSASSASATAAAAYSAASRPTASPYAPYTTAAAPYAATPSSASRYSASPAYGSSYSRSASPSSSSLSSSLPSSATAAASPSSSPYSQYSAYSPAGNAYASSSDPSSALRTRFSSAIGSGENYSPITASRFKSGVIYESDY